MNLVDDQILWRVDVDFSNRLTQIYQPSARESGCAIDVALAQQKQLGLEATAHVNGVDGQVAFRLCQH